MSRINGEKARSALAKRARTKQRVKDRARLAELRHGNAGKSDTQQSPPKKTSH